MVLGSAVAAFTEVRTLFFFCDAAVCRCQLAHSACLPAVAETLPRLSRCFASPNPDAVSTIRDYPFVGVPEQVRAVAPSLP